MKMPDFAYHRPESLAEALDVLGRHAGEAKVLAGGQSLLPVMALRLSQPRHVVDLDHVAELMVLAPGPGGGVTVGAMVRHADVERSELVARDVPLLARTMKLIGHPAIRSRGTVCGSLAHADPAAELPALALATGAEIVVRSATRERVLTAADFFVSFLTTALEPDEMVVEVRLPSPEPRTGGSIREVSRRHGDFALVGVCCSVTLAADGTVRDAALAYFGVDSTPVRADGAEKGLVGSTLDATTAAAAAHAAAQELEPADDLHATAAYRRHVAERLTRRALVEAGHRAGGAA